MRQLILIFVVLLYVTPSNAQTTYIYKINEQNGKTISTCKGQFTSSQFVNAGNNGYNSNENYTVTFCSGGGTQLRVNFYYVELEAGFDKLEVFDGPTTSSPKLATLTGNTMYPGVYTSTGTCLTFRFKSDAYTNVGRGWQAFLGCPPKACGANPPASDECYNATQICNLDGYCGTTSGWYTRGTQNLDGKTWGGPGTFSCGAIQNSSWLSFTASATTATFNITASHCSFPADGIQIMIFETDDCKNYIGRSACENNGIGTFPVTATGLTIGKKYYIMVDGNDGNDCDYVIQAASGVQTINITPMTSATTYCTSTTLVLHANVTGAGTFTYNWSPAPVSGQGTATATYAAQAITYSCTITGACGDVTATYTPVINSNPVVKVAVTGSDTICSDASGTTLTASSTLGNPSINFVNNNTYNIPNNNATGVISDIIVSGMVGTVNSQLKSVSVNISHGAVGDLSISLRCPGGSKIDLSSNNGGKGDDYVNTVFSYTGPSITTGNAPFTGTYVPEQTLSLLEGCVANGTWSLIVTDNAVPEAGVINGWALTFENGVSYSWSPATGLSATTGPIVTANPPVTTTYTVTATDKIGCQGSASATITVEPTPLAPNVVSPVTYCIGATASPLSATGTGLLWYTTPTGGIGSATAPTPSTAVIGTTHYYVSQTAGRCESPRADITVIINDKDNASFTYPTSTYCKTGGIATPTITGVSGGTFSASPAGLNIDPVTGVITINSATPQGTYIITYVTPIGACRNSATFSITVTNAPNADFSYPSKSYCKNASNPAPIFPAGSSAGIFTVTPAGLVFVNNNTGVIDLTASAAGTYIIKDSIPASGVCASSVSSPFTITIYAAPKLTTADKAEVCSGTPLNIALAGTLNSTFSWMATDNTNTTGESLGAQTTPVIKDAIFNNTPIPQLVNYIVTLTSSASNGACSSSGETIVVTVNPLPKADTTSLNIDTSHCGAKNGAITGIVLVSGIAPLTYQWVDAFGKTVGNTLNLPNVGPGTYVLTIKDANGCITKIGAGKTLNVISVKKVKAAFIMDPESGEAPLLVNFTNNTVGASNYSWDFGTGDVSSEKNPSYTYQQKGTFNTCLIADDGSHCRDTVCRAIHVYINTEFIIPNIFTPNNDGFNDIFKVPGKGIGKIDAEIFNKWGQRMYSWNTINGGWDGRTASGVEAVDGTYYYIIQIEGFEDKGVAGKKFIAKGELTLTR